MTKKDFYALLGLSRDASPEEIRQAYFEAARRLHPDKTSLLEKRNYFWELRRRMKFCLTLKNALGMMRLSRLK
jgi:curved DNA-binding protein CbpA